MSNDRGLWSMVLLQARDDLADEPIGSTEYENAVSFFTMPFGPWAQSREAIADQLGLHTDDIERLGRTVIAARRAAEGLPPAVESKPRLPLPKAKPRPPKPRQPLPELIAIPAPQPANDNKRRRGRPRHKHEFNPFNPLLRNQA